MSIFDCEVKNIALLEKVSVVFTWQKKNSVMTIFLQFFQVLRTEERLLHFVVCAG